MFSSTQTSCPELMRFATLILGSILLITSTASAQASIGEVVGSEASVKGAVVVLANGGTRMLSGSTVTAASNATSLQLARGGEVRICPRSTLSITTNQGGRDLMFGLGTGTIETHYTLDNSADTVLTPDFRILFAGPGNFHFAVGTDIRGNTCVRALAGNTASLIVTELMGDGIYQVTSRDQVTFHEGRTSKVEPVARLDCGCPATLQPVKAGDRNFGIKSPKSGSGVVHLPSLQTISPPRTVPAGSPEVALEQFGRPNSNPLPETNAGELHIQVDAPLVFNAKDLVPPPPEVTRLQLVTLPDLLFDITVKQPEMSVQEDAKQKEVVEPKSQRKKGFFGKLRSVFASIFR